MLIHLWEEMVWFKLKNMVIKVIERMTLDWLERWNKYTRLIPISSFTVEETDVVDFVLVTLAGDCTSCNLPNQLCILDHSSGQVFFFSSLELLMDLFCTLAQSYYCFGF